MRDDVRLVAGCAVCMLLCVAAAVIFSLEVFW